MTLRVVALITITLFTVSTVIPVVAGVLRLTHPPRWLQFADLGLAALLLCAAGWLSVAARASVGDPERLAALRATSWVAGLIPVLLVAFFLVGSRWDWTVLVIGLGWRAWLLLYTLPSLFGALRGNA